LDGGAPVCYDASEEAVSVQNAFWDFVVHTSAMFLAFATFVGLCFIVVNAIVKEK